MSDNKINAYNAFNRTDAAHGKSGQAGKKEQADKKDQAGHGSEVSSDKQADQAAQNSQVDRKLTVGEAKQQHNAAILQASLNVSIASKNDSLTLLYKTAIENINEVLAPELGEEAIQKAAASGEDHSPEGTATRILSFIAAIYEIYRGQKVEAGQEKSEEEMATDFINIVSKGVDIGFKEARGILSGLGVLEGEIASNIDKTYELVQKGMQAFIDTKKPKEQTEEANTGNTQATDKPAADKVDGNKHGHDKDHPGIGNQQDDRGGPRN